MMRGDLNLELREAGAPFHEGRTEQAILLQYGGQLLGRNTAIDAQFHGHLKVSREI